VTWVSKQIHLGKDAKALVAAGCRLKEKHIKEDSEYGT